MQDSNSDMAIKWTDNDKENLKRYHEVVVFKQNVVEKQMKQSELPTDIHLVDYTQDNQCYTDAVRASKMSLIFDAYYDKLKSMGSGSVTRIRSGFGNIKPVLFQVEKEKGDK